ncbi:MAG: PAS domain-containing protein [Burkholderiaceae bacterium]
MKRANAHLELAMQVSRLGAIEFDYSTGYCQVDQNAARLFGLGESACEVTREQVHATFHPDDRRALDQVIAKTLDPDGDGYFEMDHRVLSPADGSVRWLRVRKQVVFDEINGKRKPARAMLAAIDVTTERSREAAIRRSEQRYRTLAESMGVIAWACPLDGRHVEPQPAWMEFTGQTAQEMLGNGWTQAIHSHDVAGAAEKWVDSVESLQPFEHTLRVRRFDGEWRWMQVYAAVIRDSGGRPLEWFGMHSDITAQRLQESTLRESEALLSAALAAGQMGVWSWNVDDNVSIWSKREYELLGLEVGDGPEPTDRFFQLVHPHDLPALQDNMESALRTGARFDHEFRVVHSSGEVRWLAGTGRVERNASGQPVRMIGINYDITSQRESRAKLQSMASQLAEADRRKNVFLATLAHELRNPLAPIRTGLELLKGAADNPALLEKVRQLMERQTNQLVALVDDLLDVARITQNKFELRKARIELASVVEAAVEACSSAVDRAGHTLAVNTATHPVVIDADLNRLTQIVCNLLNNAAKYTPSGGSLLLSAYQQGADAVITVSDNGIGIAPDQQERIFEMFAQIDHAQITGHTGLGVGLALVRSLVQMHGGNISVHSDGPDQGSTFTVRLPVSEQQFPTEQAAVDPGAGPEDTPSLRILVVDDNDDAAQSLTMLIENLGYEVHTASDGRQAIIAAADLRPDIVLMDIGMPGMNGIEAARAIRNEPWGKKPVLIALTGWGQDSDRQQTEEAGFDQHFVKPIDAAALTHLLASLRDRVQRG